ncbi:hypothetical protein ACT453_55435, partial [Bacillus sp. D-CC]
PLHIQTAEAFRLAIAGSLLNLNIFRYNVTPSNVYEMWQQLDAHSSSAEQKLLANKVYEIHLYKFQLPLHIQTAEAFRLAIAG